MKDFIYILLLVGLLIGFPVVLSVFLARFGGQAAIRQAEFKANKKLAPNRSQR